MGPVLCPVVVGRDDEVSALAAAVDGAAAGDGRCVVVLGEAGIGKSRLAREAAAMAAGRGLVVVNGRAVPASSASPYRPVSEALMQLVRSRPLPGDDPSLARWLPALAALLPSAEAEAAAAGPPARGEAVLQLVGRLAPEGLAMVLEDLHWADPDTVALVEYLADNLSGLPFLLLFTARTEPSTAALDLARRQRGRPGITQLALDRLADADVERMVELCRPHGEASVASRVVRTADGVPLLVEELLAAGGIPESISDTVGERLCSMAAAERTVIEAAAVLGRQFDWSLLAEASGEPAEVVSRALSAAVDRQLVVWEDEEFRFRHALTREAVLASVLPPRRRELAARTLAAVDAAHPDLPAPWPDVAADLAVRAGDRGRAGRLLLSSGCRSLDLGALATAVDALRRAAELLEGSPERSGAELALIEALALAGRVEEAAAVGLRLIGRLGDAAPTTAERVEAHLRLAQAAVGASRWTMARHHLAESGALDPFVFDGVARARAGVLAAEAALAGDGDHSEARRLASEVLEMDDVPASVQCHALEVLGRSHRLVDLDPAADAFGRALRRAEEAGLPLWRLRALHELGTVELFTHHGVERLEEALDLALSTGAQSTAAVLQLQLSALYTARWQLDRCDQLAASAARTGERLRLDAVRAKALVFLAGTASMRADLDSTDELIRQTAAVAPDDAMLRGFCLQTRGMAALLAGDRAGAEADFGAGAELLGALPHAEPAATRGLWPVLLAAAGDRRAAAELERIRRSSVVVLRLNRGMLGYAEAVLAGRGGQPARAAALVAQADDDFVNCDGWRHLARWLSADAAAAAGWGHPGRWLEEAAAYFESVGLTWAAADCRGRSAAGDTNPWAALGVTDREADVLRLLAAGRPNKEIAAALHLSPRTVEKHVENLLRKTGSRSRTELAVTAGATWRSSPAT
ncbi:MAG TPA: AAA family ATPase [Acidimicrobiales bacterium]|nr:AAA family ATPase [Acidimicrobiales bacterium]